MERIRVGRKQYTDPDVLSLIRAQTEPIDPQQEVIRKARELNQKLRDWGHIDNPRQRMEILASLAGIKVSAMDGAGIAKGGREALIYQDSDGRRQIHYDPSLPEGRINFSIGHEIVHTFFPSSMGGARFRSMCSDDSKEGNELERLCHRGAAELLMPVEEFVAEIGDRISLSAVSRACETFGSSFEATVYRMATTYRGTAIAGLLKYRYRKGGAKQFRLTKQSFPLLKTHRNEIPQPKLRRQSLHTSEACCEHHLIPWNKSFAEESCVYRAASELGIHSGYERLPNACDDVGIIEAIRAPFQWEQTDPDRPDVLFLWWK